MKGETGHTFPLPIGSYPISTMISSEARVEADSFGELALTFGLGGGVDQLG